MKEAFLDFVDHLVRSFGLDKIVEDRTKLIINVILALVMAIVILNMIGVI